MRKIIKINEDKCVGCGLCASACQEGAIGMVDGKAKLLREDYCDGLGNCLPVCPTEAISFEEREVPETANREVANSTATAPISSSPSDTLPASHLAQWPVQIQLVPVNAPYFANARLLVAADCAAYVHGNFHNDYMKGKITLIGCPKLDDADYAAKLTAILKTNNIKSITVVRLEVPCCGGIEAAVKAALTNCGKLIPWQVVTFSTDGRVVSF